LKEFFMKKIALFLMAGILMLFSTACGNIVTAASNTTADSLTTPTHAASAGSSTSGAQPSSVVPASSSILPVKPAPILTPDQYKQCFGTLGTIDSSIVGQIGDIVFYSTVGRPGMNYPYAVLPEGTTSPYRLQGQWQDNFTSSFVGWADPSGKDHPFGSMLFVQVCNLSTTATHHLTETGALINNFKPYTGSLNAWVPYPCFTSYYINNPAQVVENGGCGGAFVPDVQGTATFPKGSRTGTVVKGKMTGDGTLAPGQTISVGLDVTLPSVPGTYTLVPTLQIDHGNVHSGLTDDVVGTYLYAPVAHLWDGNACTKQSVPSSPVGNFICAN
jgi:hypothetical protein